MALLPFYMTAVMFHIASIAAARGWSAGLIAASFPALALANVCGLFLSGQIIDRVSARKLFLFQSLPLLAGIAVLAASASPAALPVSFALMGFSGGLSKTTMTAVWAEVFGVHILGTVRSAAAMYMTFISALAPFVFGVALSAGMTVSAILTVFVVTGLIFLLPAVHAERRAFA